MAKEPPWMDLVMVRLQHIGLRLVWTGKETNVQRTDGSLAPEGSAAKYVKPLQSPQTQIDSGLKAKWVECLEKAEDCTRQGINAAADRWIKMAEIYRSTTGSQAAQMLEERLNGAS